jgi:transposase
LFRTVVIKSKGARGPSALQVLPCGVYCKTKVVFKDYTPNQGQLLPPSLEELITNNHPVRVVNTVIDGLDLSGLIKTYKGGGTSSHHPRMLLKVLVYGYLSNIFSSRRLEEACGQNVHFMWLAAMSRPDHNTINRFRSERLKDEIKQIFTQVVLLLEKEGLVSLHTAFVDGTKIEANANRYTFVWGKAIKKSKERIAKQLEELWTYTQKIAADELKDQHPVEFKSVDSKKVERVIKKIDRALKDKKIPSKVRQKLTYAKKNWPVNLKKYTRYEKLLGDRNSFSKTDTAATFMRMKEDHMRNGQLKPAYNLQLSTHDQFILHYSIHSNPGDTKTLEGHLNSFKKHYKRTPKEVVADAGYGSASNYKMLKRKKIRPYVKYSYFDREQKAAKRNKPIKNPIVDPEITALYTEVRHLLTTERGIRLRKQRAHDVETVFAQIKNNKGFRRFTLRGTQKVQIETGLIAVAHNLKKWAA